MSWAEKGTVQLNILVKDVILQGIVVVLGVERSSAYKCLLKCRNLLPILDSFNSMCICVYKLVCVNYLGQSQSGSDGQLKTKVDSLTKELDLQTKVRGEYTKCKPKAVYSTYT